MAWLYNTGARLNTKAVFPGMDFRYKDKTVVRPSYLCYGNSYSGKAISSLIARFMGPTWGPSGAGRTQVGPMLAP